MQPKQSENNQIQKLDQQSTRKKSQQYLQSLHEAYKRKSFLPSYEIKYEIGNIRQKLQTQKETLVLQLKEQKILTQAISEEELVNYYLKKQQYTHNQIMIQLLKKVNTIFQFIQVSFPKSQHQAINTSDQQTEILKNEFHSFTKMFKLIEDLDNFYSQNSSALNRYIKAKTTESNNALNKIYQSIFDSVCSKSNKSQIEAKMDQIVHKYQLPFKRNKNQKEIEQIIIQPKDQSFLRQLLHRQACEYALSNFLASMTSNQSSFKYSSLFFGGFYKKLQSSVSYLFIESHESHNALEPGWMFDYIQESFTINYRWLKNTLLQAMNPQAQGNILIYILQYSIETIFYENIKSRLQTDLNNQENVKQPFFYYKFIDSVHQLEQKLTLTFSQEVSLLESLLIEFQVKRGISILDRNFDYEHNWIQSKIFKDFWDNINYSHIDLKNIEAYNIVTNFNVLFEKLYSKFSSIYDKKLSTKINKFYQDTVKNLAAHIKTSFQRIYSHSGLDRLSIILAFKRVDNEFRAGLQAFIGKDLEFQKEIKKQYYDYIRVLFEEYAYEHVNLYHRKLLKLTTEYERLFTETLINEDDRTRLMEKAQKIFKDWQTKIEELNQVYSYRDSKIKNQFFTFLESIDFGENGIQLFNQGIGLFLHLYEPFLKVHYSFEAYNVLKMVILMDKKQQLEELKVHNTLLGFLLESELSAIRKMKMK